MFYRLKECVFLGYNLNHKGYKCLDPQTHRLYISRQVLFNECSFPFSKIQDHSSNNHVEQISSDVAARPPLLPTAHNQPFLSNNTYSTPSVAALSPSANSSQNHDLSPTNQVTFPFVGHPNPATTFPLLLSSLLQHLCTPILHQNPMCYMNLCLHQAPLIQPLFSTQPRFPPLISTPWSLGLSLASLSPKLFLLILNLILLQKPYKIITGDKQWWMSIRLYNTTGIGPWCICHPIEKPLGENGLSSSRKIQMARFKGTKPRL